MSTGTEVLEAGGMIATTAKRPPSDDYPLDVVEARSFQHPGLGEPVVRVALKPLATAIDAEMGVLGFGPGESLGDVGVTRRRGLGFPGAAILADPDNARYAIEVVQDLAKAARRAQSKPGHAKEAIDKIGKRLGKSVPHFLPSYYEEASRIFIECGNVSYAGQMFEKAREAERVHALEVDEQLRENTFVEFALAGALSVKSLSNYAKELASASEPAEAYAVFRRVCVRRTLGGLPPWAKMATELKRLIKAAKLDLTTEEMSLLAEIIDAPALNKAQTGFWKSYKKSLAKMCKEDPATRGHLLNLFPADVDTSEWLDILSTCGALEGLLDPGAAPETRPSAGPASWFSKLAAACGGWRSKVPPQALELLEQAAPVLEEEGKPLALFQRWGDCDLDMIELAMSLGLSLADPQEHSDFDDLERWAERASEHEVFGRDPVHVAADERYAKMLREAMTRELGSEPFTTLALTMDGFRDAIRDWLSGQIDRLAGAKQSRIGLPGLYNVLDTLGNSGLRPVWVAFPDERERFAATRAVGPLAVTLRTGIYDEYSWPAFEEALAKLAENAELKIGGAFPHIVVSDGVKALVVGPTSIVAEHDLKLPKGADLEGFRWVQNQLMVIFEPDDTWESHGYWSGNPSEHFKIEGSFYSYGAPNDRGVVMGDGSVVFGEATMTAGDRKVGRDGVVFDGESFWVSEYDGFRELDPRTSKKGRKSAPAFVSEYAQEGSEISYGACTLYPLPAEVTASPFGQRGELTGKRVRHRDESSPKAASVPWSEVERIDGIKWVSSEEYQTPDALMTFPGDDRPRPVETGYTAGIVAPDSESYAWGSSDNPQYRRGTRVLPPPVFWHYFLPRDVAGSRALRGLTDEGAAALLEAAETDLAASAGKVDDHGMPHFELEGSALSGAIAEALPGLSHDKLKIGVSHIALMAARDQGRIARITDLSAADEDNETPSGEHDPKGLQDAVRDIEWIYESQGNIAEMKWISSLFASAADGDGERQVFPSTPGADCDWLPLCANAGKLAYRAALAATPEQQRNALIQLLEAMASSWVFEHLGELRFIELEGKLDQGAGEDQSFLFVEDGNHYFGWNSWDDYHKVLEWAPNGEFRTPAGQVKSIDDETRFEAGWLQADSLQAFVAKLSGSEPVDINPLAEKLSEPTGLTLTESLYVLAGFPRDTDDFAKALDLKKARAEQAAAGARMSGESASAILGAALAANPLALWDDPEAFVTKLGTAWVDRVGAYPQLDEDFLEVTAKELRNLSDLPGALRAIGNPGRGPLATDNTFKLEENGRVVPDGKTKAEAFDEELLERLLPLIAHLFLNVEVGHPIRSMIPDALQAIGDRLESAALWLSLPDLDFEDKDKRAAFLADYGGEPMKGLPDSRERDGVRLIADDYDCLEVWVQPVVFRDNRAAIDALLPKMGWEPVWLNPLRFFYDGALAKFAERVRDTPVPDGEFECNPIHSVPDLVEEVGNDLDLDQNAAALYLQLAALPAPRDKSIREWNGWKPKDHKAAAKKLLDRELVVEAKRSRAGRSHFVPGGWEPFKNPLLPIESWKLGLYGIEVKDGHAKAPLGQILPSVPVHEVFAEAYKRIKAGKGPAYEAPGK